jgi:hypothetical protein
MTVDLDAWRDHIETKRERNHYFWRLEEKARESQLNPRKKKVRPVITDTCPECTKPFEKRQDHQRYCSKACRDKASKRRTRAAREANPTPPTKCLYCQTPIPADMHAHRIYCNEMCRRNYRRTDPNTVKPCKTCGVPMRPVSTTLEDHPGTVLRGVRGECRTCVRGVRAREDRARKCAGCDTIIPAGTNIRREYCTSQCRRRAGHVREKAAARLSRQVAA